MKLADIIFMAMDGIKERKSRVGLNVLGIMIGISALVALLSIGEGMSVTIREDLELLDPTTIMVMPGRFMETRGGQRGEGLSPTRGDTLTLRDIDRLEKISGVALATPVITRTVKTEISGYSDSVTVAGIIPEEYTQVFATLEVTEGRWLGRSDDMSAVLGARVAHPQYLEEPIARLGSRVTLHINEQETVTLRVAGILEEVGGMTIGSTDHQVFVTFETAQRIFHTGITANSIIAKAETTELVDKIKEEIQDEFQNKLDKEVTVMSYDTFLGMAESVTSTMETVLGGVAAVSLVVAGIAIINTTTISVMERTREIGVMKAMGAKNRNILMMFLTETLVTGLIGGVVGVAFGALLGQIVAVAMTNLIGTSLTSVLSLTVGAVGIAFAAITGTLAGLYPSRKASKLVPVEALRYE